MADLKLKTVTRTQGNNQALKDGTVKPKMFACDFVEVDMHDSRPRLPTSHALR